MIVIVGCKFTTFGAGSCFVLGILFVAWHFEIFIGSDKLVLRVL